MSTGTQQALMVERNQTPLQPNETAEIFNSATEKTIQPQNTFSDMRKYFKDDIFAAFVVACVSLVLSPALAVASGFPAVAGIYAAILANTFLAIGRKAYNIIGGPAAGLVAALTTALYWLGANGTNNEQILPLLAASIAVVGLLQILVSYTRVPKILGSVFPTAVIEGMMTGIGITIATKELAHATGGKFHGHEYLEILKEIPSLFLGLHPKAFVVAIITLATIIVAVNIKAKLTSLIPPQVFGIFVGTVAAIILGLEQQYLLYLPNNPFEHGIILPDFSGLGSFAFASFGNFVAVLAVIFLIFSVDSVETIATTEGMDAKDRFGRKSDSTRVLSMMGFANLLSGAVGATTNIPGGAKSTTNINAGGKTIFVNAYIALILLSSLVLAYFGLNLFSHLPLPALGVVLIYTGYKLFEPKIFKHMWKVGMSQFSIFFLTAFVTVFWGLLEGIIVGFVAKLFFNSYRNWEINSKIKTTADKLANLQDKPKTPLGLVACFTALFANPVKRGIEITKEGIHKISISGPLTNANVYVLTQLVNSLPKDSKIELDFRKTNLIDPTAVEKILRLQRFYPNLSLKHYDRLRKATEEPISYGYNFQIDLAGAD